MNPIRIQHWSTKNGTQVFFIERHELPILDISINFDAGSCYDGEKYGLSSFTNLMLSQDTKNYNANQIAHGFEEVGAQFHFTSDRDTANLSLRSLIKPKYLDAALNIFNEIISAPTFPREKFSHTQKLIMSAIKTQEHTQELIAKKILFSTLYHDHPYGHPVLGTLQSVPLLTARDLRNFYGKFYVAKKLKIILVGNINQKKADAISNQIAEKLLTGEPADRLPQVPIDIKMIEERIFFPSEQTHILMGQVSININDKNYFPLLVGNHIFGGSTLASRLFNKVRKKYGLAYNITSAITLLKLPSPFVIILQTENNTADRARNIVNQELAFFRNHGPTKSELRQAKNKMINNFPLTLARNDSLASQLRMMCTYHLPLTYLNTYCENINAVTLEQVRSSFEQIINPIKMTTIMVGRADISRIFPGNEDFEQFG